jgi:hypothetical protein
MKQYPSISHIIRTDIPIYAFDKLDGSNIRAEWERKKGFWKFGTRRRLLGDDEPVLGKAVELVQEKYNRCLEETFYNLKLAKVVCFFEFWGPKSFAGLHEEDDDHTVTLLDVNPYKRGILEPRLFIKHFGHLDIPKVIYYGKANQDFARTIRKGGLDITFEGVVCKGVAKKQIIMFKIKNRAWIDKVKEFYAGDERMLKELIDPADLEPKIPVATSHRDRRFCPGCFKAGQLAPACLCGEPTLDMDYYAQPPKVRASKTKWKRFFRQWYPEENFKERWKQCQNRKG